MTNDKNALLSARGPIVFLTSWLVIYLIFYWSTPYDDTDDQLNGERSGMALYTDNLTGCQYLSGGLLGGITPRLDGSGKHIGCR